MMYIELSLDQGWHFRKENFSEDFILEPGDSRTQARASSRQGTALLVISCSVRVCAVSVSLSPEDVIIPS